MSGPPPVYYGPRTNMSDLPSGSVDYAQWVEGFDRTQYYQTPSHPYGSSTHSTSHVYTGQSSLNHPSTFPQQYQFHDPQYTSLRSQGSNSLLSGWNNTNDGLYRDPGPSLLDSQSPFQFAPSHSAYTQHRHPQFGPVYSSAPTDTPSPGSSDTVAPPSRGSATTTTPPTLSTALTTLPPPQVADGDRPRKRRHTQLANDNANEEKKAPAGDQDTSATLTRKPGACKHCKKSKMKCDFPPGENTCKRCKASGRLCVVEGPKPQSQREELLAQIRQKDAVIESLLRQLSARTEVKPASHSLNLAQDQMSALTEPHQDFNIDTWVDHLSRPRTSEEDLRSTHRAPPSRSLSCSDSEASAGTRSSVASSLSAIRGGNLNTNTDEAVPIGFIAKLSLSDAEAEKSYAKSTDDNGEDDVLGWADKAYFKPDTNIPMKITIPDSLVRDSLPEVVVHGLVTPTDVDKLFKIYFSKMNVHIDILDPVLHTPANTFSQCPFLFSVVCAVASRYYDKPQIHPIAMHFAKHAAANALISGRKCVELALAYMLLSYYAEPAKRWQDQRVWLYIGLGLRVATDLNPQQTPKAKPTNEQEERERLNRDRVWLNCYILDRSVSTLYGRPFTFKEDRTIRDTLKWYKRSKYNAPIDIGLCAYASMLRITSGFHEEVFSDPDAPASLNKDVDFLGITTKYDNLLNQHLEEWQGKFNRDAKLDDPQVVFRMNLLPYITNYSRLVMWSFGFQQAFQRGMETTDRIFLDKCFTSASAVVETMLKKLAPSGYMRYSSEGHITFATFASAFLVKLLKPEFVRFFDSSQRIKIFELIEQLVQTYSSVEVAPDEKLTPRQHARFLSSLVSKYRKTLPSSTATNSEQPTAQTSVGSSLSSSSTMGAMDTPLDATSHPTASSSSSQDQPIPESLDRSLPMNLDDGFMGALEVFKNPNYWESMMMPGLNWPDQSMDVNDTEATPPAGVE